MMLTNAKTHANQKFTPCCEETCASWCDCYLHASSFWNHIYTQYVNFSEYVQSLQTTYSQTVEGVVENEKRFCPYQIFISFTFWIVKCSTLKVPHTFEMLGNSNSAWMLELSRFWSQIREVSLISARETPHTIVLPTEPEIKFNVSKKHAWCWKRRAWGLTRFVMLSPQSTSAFFSHTLSNAKPARGFNFCLHIDISSLTS